MEIVYTEEKKFTQAQVQALFLSVDWVSGAYPERLYKALMHSSTVLTAWDGTRLVGLARVLDDTEMTAFLHYVLVDPAYHGCGIGGGLVWRGRSTGTISISTSCPRSGKTSRFMRTSASGSCRRARPCRSAIRGKNGETGKER